MRSLILSAIFCAAIAITATASFAKKEAAKAEPINKTCPVSSEAADPKVTAEHAGKTVAFCCKGCVKDFKKNPDQYLEDLAAKGDDSTAKKDEAKKTSAKKEKPSKLNKTCPVHPDRSVDTTVTTEYKGKTIGFCCEDCLKAFNADPDRYVKAGKKK